MAIEMIEPFDQGTQIKVIGVGGGGGNAVEPMLNEGVQGVEFGCANTHAQELTSWVARAWVRAASPRWARPRPKRRSRRSATPSPAPTCCSSRRAWAAARAP